MISAYTGKTGSGKTYRMIEAVYKYWLSGWDIYSNTVLNFEALPLPKLRLFHNLIRKWFKKDPLPLGRIVYFQDITEILDSHNAIICFDEAQVLFNARNWEALPDDFSYKLQQHRKHGLHLFATMQNLGTVDINYRRLVQEWWHCTDKFALFARRNPSLLSIHTAELKDIDMLYNSVDDLKVDTLLTKRFFIHKWKRRLYDTLYDIGFHRFKIICLSLGFGKSIKKQYWIIPKRNNLMQQANEAKKQQMLIYPRKVKK